MDAFNDLQDFVGLKGKLKFMQDLHDLRTVMSSVAHLSKVSSKRRRSRGLEQSPWV